jgi:phenylacetate-CoA ligase
VHPKLVKHVLFPIHEKLCGRSTYRALRELEQLQWASREEIQALQFRKLKSLLIHADENIPFYRDRFSAARFKPRNMTSVEDFRHLPFLTKADIRENLDRMKWLRCPGGLHRYNTGGSSGEPLIFYFDRRRQAWDAAARALTHQWWSVDIGDRELYLWGSPVEITKQDRVKQIRDTLTNQMLMSAFELSMDKMPSMVAQLHRFRPKCVFGYPSSIALFCQMAGEKGYDLSREGVQVVFATAEVLYEHWRETISKAFGGAPVADGYGSREGGFIAHHCSEETYHVIDPNYIIEYIRGGDGQAFPGEEGEIVITHLDAWGMPLIRYRTGDVARAGKSKCSCGRYWSTMEEIRGRTTDFIVTPDGRWQHALSLIYIVRDIGGVEAFKIFQEELDKVTVLLKIRPGLYPKDGNARISQEFRKRMGDEVQVLIREVSEIPRDVSGKHRYVVSKVARS